MDRRKFLKIAGKSSLGLVLTSQISAASNSSSIGGKKMLKAKDIQNYLRSLSEVGEPSVDRIIIGKADTVVTKIGTAWMPYWKTCRKAVKQGINTLVVHEPTFYTHWDLDAKDSDYFRDDVPGRKEYFRLRAEKIKWLNENGLVIIRCHDVLDKVADFGIPYALGKFLGFSKGDLLRSRKFYNVYKIDQKPAIEVARYIAEKLKVLGQPGVAFYGDPGYKVNSVGVGTGCICNPIEFMDLEPDLFIAIDDTVRTWTQTTYAEDTGRPLVVINHGTSEEHGMKMLNAHLKEAFPDKDVIHLEQGCTYKWVTA
ncbi:MAG: Nif3-like dinuclear metal center hexameric protein [Planctomycetota bacterium]|jgi:putative NIF3 family GTP cyclohydrolase 1 type 2